MVNTRIDAATERFALLGGTLAHTWSPQIHNSIFDAGGVNAIYLPMPCPPETLQSMVEVMRTTFSGFNVTIPYKEAVIPFLDELDETATACGAVNTVEITPRGSLIGHNTDGLGLSRALREGFVELNNTDAVVLGAGGAARIAAFEVLKRGGRVMIAARDAQKREAFVHSLAETQKDGAARISHCAMDDIPGTHELLINCTPVGMYPHSDACPVEDETLDRFNAVFDMIYNPPVTRLLAAGERLGLKTVGGFGMLYYQAVEAQKIWFGREIAPKSQRAIKKELEKLL